MRMFPNCPNAYLYEDIPAYMYMLQHILSDREVDIASAPKSFCDTERTPWVNNHLTMSGLTGDEISHWRSRDDAELFHYRSEAYDPKMWLCEDLISHNKSDKRIWNYKESLINSTLSILYNLKFYN